MKIANILTTKELADLSRQTTQELESAGMLLLTWLRANVKRPYRLEDGSAYQPPQDLVFNLNESLLDCIKDELINRDDRSLQIPPTWEAPYDLNAAALI